jgi:molybdopterin synthase catalytic subunit
VFEITDRPIDLARLQSAVVHPGAGAIVTFVGTTRNENVGRRVIRLEYEAFATMAQKEMRKLATAARKRWPLRRVAMAHRIGVVPVRGERRDRGLERPSQGSVRGLSPAHRSLEEIVPIWKKEHFRGGQVDRRAAGRASRSAEATAS